MGRTKPLDRELCHCMKVTEREVLSAIRGGAWNVEDVGDACEAGTGCGSCREGIEEVIERERQRVARKGLGEDMLRQLALFGK